jgi:hypothetical protein
MFDACHCREREQSSAVASGSLRRADAPLRTPAFAPELAVRLSELRLN